MERALIRKIWWRITPLLALVLLFNYLDKVNLGFAAVTMNKDLGFSNTTFGAGAGFFAIGYALFGIPSTLILHRVGARRWIGLIMVAWGLCSAATALVTRPAELLGVRLLLGVAEAGFTPGIILYFTHWFPRQYRGRVLGSFLLIYPLSLVIGGPFSAALFRSMASWVCTDGSGCSCSRRCPRWFWPCGVAVLTDSPQEAHWLSATERTWLQNRLDSEAQQIQRPMATRPAGRNSRAVACGRWSPRTSVSVRAASVRISSCRSSFNRWDFPHAIPACWWLCPDWRPP